MLKSPTPQAHRVHAVDALRVVALLLLIVYHCSVLFQPWSAEIGWMQNERLLLNLWIPMSMLNVWRIPILFVISGMGVFFAMQRRTNRELLKDRVIRILVPYVFGFVIVGAICKGVDQYAKGEPVDYVMTDYHLWFLLNIFVYVLLSFPLLRRIYDNPDGFSRTMLRQLLHKGWFVFAFTIPGAIFAGLIQPEHFPSYHHNLHGFIYGAICFGIGFLCASEMTFFQTATKRWRWRLTVTAFALWGLRFTELMNFIPELLWWKNPITAVESMVWMLAVMGHAFQHWSNGFKGLKYANSAVYPVYIVHQPMQNILALFFLHLPWNPWLEFFLLTTAILLSSVILYEGIRRVRWLRPLFGMPQQP